ncbi:MAG: hypothetical protein WD226_12020 [Planctomycetota bacterium]
MQIHEAPHGINLVVETDETVYIGRFDSSNGFQVLMHDACVHPIEAGEDVEAFVRQTAKFGIPVDEKNVTFDAHAVKRVRVLGDIAKD